VRATTAACPDVTPPTVPARLAVSAATAENISIGWAPSTDNVGVQSYSLFVDGKPAGTTAAPLATFSGLACGHTYVLGVAAIDAAGNTSPRAEISASTAPCSTDLHVAPNGADFGWSFISTVYDGTSVRLYVDGKLAATKPVSGAIEHSTGDLRIGGNSIWGEWFKGKIDNVRVYDRALSEPELSTDMGTAVTDGAVPGLVAAYTFDEGSGTGVADASRHGNSGTISNAAWAADGKFGGSLSFNGTNGSVRVPDSASLDLTGAMTLEAWVHPDELGGTWRTALVKEAGDHLDYALYANATDPADPAPTSGTPSGHVFIGADTSAKAPASLAPNDCRNALQPCLTIDRAYHAALPGQTVTLAPGAYPEQTVTADPTKIAPRVVVAPAAPGTVTIDTINVHATHLEFRNLNLGLSFWNTFVDAQDVVFRDMVAGGFIISSSKDVSVFGGSYGPAVDTKSQVQPVPDNVEPENIRIEGAFFHDYTRVDPASHMECLQFGAGNGIVIRNNRFTNCNDFDLMMGIWGSVPDPRNILIENNVFDAATESLPTFGAYYSLMTGGWANQVIRNNTLLMPIAFQPFGTYVNVRAVGNLGPGTSWGCDGRVTYSHNVWLADGTDDPRCAPTDKSTTDLGLVDPTHLDVHLRADSPAIDAGDPSDYAPDDIGGRQRPLGAAPDAGAYEHG
jgi:hypothetical protein